MGIRNLMHSRLPTSDREWQVEGLFVAFFIALTAMLIWVGLAWWMALPICLGLWAFHVWNNGPA